MQGSQDMYEDILVRDFSDMAYPMRDQNVAKSFHNAGASLSDQA
jgi:hypothetical protein